jgi:hypothetical protein
MQVRFVYCAPEIYWRAAIIFSRSFDKVINTRGDRSRSRQGSLRSQVCQSNFCCMISGHPVHSTSGRGRCSAQIQPSFRSTIQRWGGAKEELSNIHGATKNIAADKIRIPSLKRGRRGHRTSQHALTKARSETSNLVFNACNVIVPTAIGNMTIGPCCVLTSRHAMRVEQGWLP